MRGDRVEIVVAADDGSRTYEITATRAGRRVEISTARGVVEVAEVTRTGEPVRRGRFMASRVIALVEHPAAETPGDPAAHARGGRTAESPAAQARQPPTAQARQAPTAQARQAPVAHTRQPAAHAGEAPAQQDVPREGA